MENEYAKRIKESEDAVKEMADRTAANYKRFSSDCANLVQGIVSVVQAKGDAALNQEIAALLQPERIKSLTELGEIAAEDGAALTNAIKELSGLMMSAVENIWATLSINVGGLEQRIDDIRKDIEKKEGEGDSWKES